MSDDTIGPAWVEVDAPAQLRALQAAHRAAAHRTLAGVLEAEWQHVLVIPATSEFWTLPLAARAQALALVRADFDRRRAAAHAQLDALLDGGDAACERDATGAAQH